jgi:hypothetical protein
MALKHNSTLVWKNNLFALSEYRTVRRASRINPKFCSFNVMFILNYVICYAADLLLVSALALAFDVQVQAKTPAPKPARFIIAYQSYTPTSSHFPSNICHISFSLLSQLQSILHTKLSILQFLPRVLRSALLWDINHRVVVKTYRCFGTTYLPPSSGFKLDPEDGVDRLSRNVLKELPLLAV